MDRKRASKLTRMIALLFALSSILLITSCQGSELPEDYAADVPTTEHSSEIQSFEEYTSEPASSAPSAETEAHTGEETAEHSSEVRSFEDTIESAASAPSEETEANADTTEHIDIPVTEETALTYYGDTPIEERWWYGIVDLDTADEKYIHDNTIVHAEWNNMAILRYSSGDFVLSYSYDDFSEAILQFVPQNEFGFLRHYDIENMLYNSDYICLSENEEINGLCVEQARFNLNRLNDFNEAVVKLNGNIVLKGVAEIKKETNVVIKRGDVFFYPYPESFSQYPLTFPPYFYGNSDSTIIDKENDFYMYADTPLLYLGNAFKGDVYTRIREMQTLGIEEPGWSANADLAALVLDEIDEGTYYELEIEVSDLFLVQCEEFMTGFPFSAANVTRIIDANKLL